MEFGNPLSSRIGKPVTAGRLVRLSSRPVHGIPRQSPDVARRRVSCPAPFSESPIPYRPATGRRRPRKKRATQSYGDGWPIVPSRSEPARYPARGARIACRIRPAMRRASAFRSPCIAAVARWTTRGR